MEEKVKYIKYSTSVDKNKKAILKDIGFPIENVDEKDLEILKELSKGAVIFSNILKYQQMPEIVDIISGLERWLSEEKSSSVRKKISDYLMIVRQQDSMYNVFGDNFIFDEKIELPRYLKKYSKFIQKANKESPKKNLYPKSFTKSDFEKLGDKDKNVVNSIVVKDDKKKFKVELLEKVFSEELKVFCDILKSCSKKTDNKSLKKYLLAKRKELLSGKQSRRIKSDVRWINLDSKIGFVVSTGLETYIDKFNGVRGGACFNLYYVDDSFQKLSETLLSYADFYEANAPWDLKNKVDSDKLPKLKFVNVYALAGDNFSFPMITIAQSLPNEDDVVKKYGTQNLVYVNIMKSKQSNISENVIYKNFFSDEAKKKYVKHIAEMSVITTALHELGHTTGTTKYKENANNLFGEYYSLMEEARAESFSLFSLKKLYADKIISYDKLIAGYYSMLETMLKAQEFEPKDHSGSRNMMFFYYLDNGGIYEKDGKYIVDKKKFEKVNNEFLKTIGNIKTNGEVEKFKEFAKKYIRVDLQKTIKKATKTAPLGAVFTFEYNRNRD